MEELLDRPPKEKTKTPYALGSLVGSLLLIVCQIWCGIEVFDSNWDSRNHSMLNRIYKIMPLINYCSILLLVMSYVRRESLGWIKILATILGLVFFAIFLSVKVSQHY